MIGGEFESPAELPTAKLGSARSRWGEPLAYEQGFLYVCQACRRGGWWFEKEDLGLFLVARDYLGPGRHSVVVPFTENLLELLDVARRCALFCRVRPVTLRHVEGKYAGKLAAAEYLRAMAQEETEQAVSLEELSEDRYPQVIAPVNHAWLSGDSTENQLVPILPRGHGYAELRYQLRRFLRDRRKSATTVEVVSLASSRRRDVKGAIDSWMISVEGRYSQTGRPHVGSFEMCFQRPVEAVIEGVRQYVHAGGVGEIVLVGGRARGGWAGAWISTRCLGVYILFADTRIRGLSEFIMYRAVHYAFSFDYAYVNLGGSEVRSLYEFKAKMAPKEAGGLRRELREFDWLW